MDGAATVPRSTGNLDAPLAWDPYLRKARMTTFLVLCWFWLTCPVFVLNALYHRHYKWERYELDLVVSALRVLGICILGPMAALALNDRASINLESWKALNKLAKQIKYSNRASLHKGDTLVLYDELKQPIATCNGNNWISIVDTTTSLYVPSFLIDQLWWREPFQVKVTEPKLEPEQPRKLTDQEKFIAALETKQQQNQQWVIDQL